MRRTIGIVVVVIIVLGLIGGGGAWYLRQSGQPKTTFRTAPVKRGDLKALISGVTGTVEPEEVVDVGAQVAGQIESFGKDESGKSIDYGSVVAENTVLANVDDSLYASDVALTKAASELAKAGHINAEANLQQMKAKLVQAQADWDRAQKLGPSSEALAPTQYDAYKANFDIAKANVAVADAGVAQAAASIGQAQAALDRAQRSLSYCTIKSPVKGVIIDRRVNIGQTVVSSLNAPSLFLIAKDLTRVQVWVSVNEADIGSITPGMPVTFTVDAFPSKVFLGTVGKTRLNATMTQNVVTYTVEVNTDNPDGKLLPYLTANVQFQTGHREDVLLVPNAALRWTPRPDQIAPAFRQQAEPASGAGRRASQPASSQEGADLHRGTLWVAQGQFVQPVKVQAGLTDGAQTEVQGSDLAEGLQVVVGEQSMESGASAGGASPFTPQLGAARRPVNAPAGSGTGGAQGGPGGGR
jgi:HlyD family secretion protein